MSELISILVVDDEPENLDLIQEALAGPGRELKTFSDPAQALRALQEQRFDILLTDLRMPGVSGLDLLQATKTSEKSQSSSGGTEVILMTAFAEIDTAVQAMKHGATDFLSKPLRIPQLQAVIAKLSELQLMRRKVEELAGGEAYPAGTGETMRRLLATARSVSETDATVLLLGETGVGKEVLADFIQKHSSRARQPFIKVNCAALTESLLESELFGHEKGAFTGAGERHIGRFERANKGTLFLDEIGELSATVQVKLLRVLQNREIERLGGQQPIPVNFRLICATHRDLERYTQEGKFREDLYYRINVFPLYIPPLRDRCEDIPALAHRFLMRAKAKIGRGPTDLHPGAVESLLAYSWPGNVRELENVIERACVIARGSLMMPSELNLRRPSTRVFLNQLPVRSVENAAPETTPSGRFAPLAAEQPHNGSGNGSGNGNGNGSGRHYASASSSSGRMPAETLSTHEHVSTSGSTQGLPALPALPPEGSSETSFASPSSSGLSGPLIDDPLKFEDPLEEAEKVTLRATLERFNWNFQAAADRLRLSRSTLYAKASKHGLKR